MIDDTIAQTRIGPIDGLVVSVAVSGAASAAAQIPGMTNTDGKCDRLYTFQAIGTDVNIIFGPSTLNAPTVSANSLRINAGAKETWCFPAGVTHYRHIGAGAGFLLITAASP